MTETEEFEFRARLEKESPGAGSPAATEAAPVPDYLTPSERTQMNGRLAAPVRGPQRGFPAYQPPVPRPYVAPESSYVPSVSPAPPANLQQNAGIGPQLKELGGVVAPAILPTIGAGVGAIGGAGLGTVLAPGPGTVAGGVIGESAGSAGGEWLNQQLGITPSSKLAIGIQAAVPPTLRAAWGGIKALGPQLAKRIPGAAAGMHEAAANVADTAVSKIGVGLRPSEQVYAEVAQAGNPLIALPQMGRAAQELGAVEAQLPKSLQNGAIRKLTEDLTTMASTPGVPFTEIQLALKRLNEKVRGTRMAGDEEHGAYQKIVQGLQADLAEAANAGVPAAKLLKEANRSYKMEMAQEDLTTWIAKAKVTARNGDALLTFSPAQVLNKLERDPYFAARFHDAPQELAQVKALFTELTSWAKTIQPPKGVQYGSGPTAKSATLGYAIGGPTGAAIMANAPGIIASAVMTAPGRAMIRRLMKSPGFSMDSSRLGMLAAAGTGMLQGSDIANELKATVEPPAPPAPSPAPEPKAEEKPKKKKIRKTVNRNARGLIESIDTEEVD